MYCVYTLLVLLLSILHLVPESSGGRYLIRQGDINIGSHVNTIFRLRCRSSAPLGSPHEMQVLMQDKRHTTYFGMFCAHCAIMVAIKLKSCVCKYNVMYLYWWPKTAHVSNYTLLP